MRKNIYLKSTLRQPVRTLFLLLLIAVISFVGIARALEYVIIQQETDRLGGYYRSIGQLSQTGAYDDDVAQGAEIVTKSPYVKFEDRRRICSGVLNGLYNSDVDGYMSDYEGSGHESGIHVSDIVVYGTLINRRYNENLGEILGKSGGYYLSFKVDHVEAGYPEYVIEGDTVGLVYFQAEGETSSIEEMEVGGRYLVRAFFHPGFVMGDWTRAGDYLIMKPLIENGPWFAAAREGASADLSADELTRLQTELEVLRENQRAMMVQTTKDMSAMPDMQQVTRLYYLTEGRWLTREDDLEVRRVCVVHNDFAKLRGLSVGSTITLTLRDLKEPSYYGYIAGTEADGSFKQAPTTEVTFEIVGLYRLQMGRLQPTSRSLELFIPDSCMPEEYYIDDTEFLYSDLYSFVLNSTLEEDAFLSEVGPELEKLGMRVTFVENNGQEFWASVLPLRQSAAVNAVLFGVVLVLALALSVFIYLRQRRRELAILRALGMPRGKALRGLLSPLLLIGGMGILAGGLLSWEDTLEKASQTLASVQGLEGAQASASLSPLWLMGACLFVFLLLVLLALIGARYVARRPVLALLQNATASGTKKGGGRQSGKKAENPPVQTERTQTEAPLAAFFPGSLPVRSGNAVLSAGRYVLRHIRRAPFKSALMAAVACLFLLALGWMTRTISQNTQEINRMYLSNVVEAEIVKSNASSIISGGSGFVREQTIQAVLDSGFVQSAYLEANVPRLYIVAGSPVGKESSRPWEDNPHIKNILLYGIDAPSIFFSNTVKNAEVEYAPGYDETFFSEERPLALMNDIPIMLPTSMMEQLGVEMGGLVSLYDDRGSGSVMICVVVGRYNGAILNDTGTLPALLPLSLLKTLDGTAGLDLVYSTARFVIDPAKNRELVVFRKVIEEAVAKPGAGLLPLTFVIWDEELRQVVTPMEKNLQLMEVLYPATILLSVLIAAGLAALLMLQSAKEAAIMRALGANKAKVKLVLCFEQALLCLIGILLGAAVPELLWGGADHTGQTFLHMGAYFGGSLIGSILAAAAVVSRKTLELLQVKE